MPTIVQALKEKGSMRVKYEDRELFWDGDDSDWGVTETKFNSRNIQLLCSTKDQKTAVAFLLGKR